MLAIRMQRTGRKGYASFRIIVQDSKFTPTSGRVVDRVGHYNPHTKDKSINIDKITKYLSEGAQPTPRVVRLLVAEKVKMPSWVLKPDNSKNSKVKNAEKLRRNRPKQEKVEETPVEEAAVEEPKEVKTEKKEEVAVEEPKAEAEEKTAEAEKASEEAPVEEDKTEKVEA